MAIPWMLALRVIPWGTILANAPSILRAADALRSNTAVQPDAVSHDDVRALADRVAALERRDRETADLLTQLSAQVAALSTAGEVLEARVRLLLVVAIVTSLVALGTLGFAAFG
jgi:uncharacterized coiled-coil protein SlyX